MDLESRLEEILEKDIAIAWRGHGVKHNTHYNLLALRQRVADPKLTGYDLSIR
jgi:hypothetical protein